MERRKWIAVVISVLVLTVLAGSITSEYEGQRNILTFHLNTSYFNPEVNASYLQGYHARNNASLYAPILSSLETNYSERTINFAFGEYTLLMTPNLLPVPLGSINLYNFSGVNLTTQANPFGFLPPDVGITMVNATGGLPGSLGFKPVKATVISPNGTGYVFNLESQGVQLSETIYAYPISIGPYYNVGTGAVNRPTNFSIPLSTGQYMLQVTVSLYNLHFIGHSYLGKLTFKEHFYNFIKNNRGFT